MDKRKLKFKTSLLKNLQSISQSSNKTENEYAGSSRSNSVLTEKINSSNDESSSNIRLSLKPMNSESSIGSDFPIESRKRARYDSQEDLFERDNPTVTSKLLKTKTVTSKLPSDRISMESTTNQGGNSYLSDNISGKDKSVNIAVTSTTKVTQKRKIATLSTRDNDSDSDLDLESTNIKKKRTESISDKSTRYISQDNDINKDSSRKGFSSTDESPIKPITKSNITKRRLQDYNDSDSDLDLESTNIKKKRPESISGKSTRYISQDNINKDSSRKGFSSADKSPIKPITKSNITKRRLQDHNDSDSDLDVESTNIKKKSHENISGKSTWYISQDNDINKDFSRKGFSSADKSPIKPITTSNITQRRLQHRIKEPYSKLESEKYSSEKHSSKKQDLHITSIFSKFLQKCGITLSANNAHILNVLPSVAKQKMKKILTSKQYEKKDIINSIQEYIQDEENFEKMLNDMEISVDDRGFHALNNVSLSRILLEITEIQTDIYNCFISKLNESVLLADTPEKIPWAVPLLHQFRFLDIIVSTDILTTNIEQLLETCPTWFTHDLILFLPDILSDAQHQDIAEILIKILEENCELTTVILNCIANFNLSKEYLEQYKDKILHLLKTNIKTEVIPAIIMFLFDDCVSPDNIKHMVLKLRDIEMQPLAGDKIEDCYKNQMQIVKTLKMCMSLTKNVTNTLITVIKEINKNPKPLDLIILLLASSDTMKQTGSESLLKQNVRSGFYRISLLQAFYNDYKGVVQELQPLILQLASRLLTSEDRVFVNFAIEWYRLQFLSQKEALFKQREIIEKIILLMGNNDKTVKHALTILCKMAENANERDCLVPHCNHLRILLEKIDYFGLEEVGTLSDLLHSLCLVDDSISESLRDDLFILLQKQLSAAKPIIKCKGVMGAVMAIKHLAGNSETHDQAFKLFNKVMKSVKNCCKSQPLFYDQLAQVITHTKLINADFLQKIRNCVEDEFVNVYMTDKLSSSKDLTPKFGLNNAEAEPQNCVLNFGNKKNGPVAPILFRLLKTCCIKLSEHGDLEAIDALLGCAILMPENFDIPEPPVLDRIICCINWFREIITGFVTQTDPLLQKQVLKRLDTLIYLQCEMSILLTLCDTKYQPSPCYFHYFPTPPFIKTEKKISKKGKKSKKGNKSASLETKNESWETGSALCSKNPVYFRQFDAKIIHLLGIKTDLQSSDCRSQSEMHNISITQVCFLVKELLIIFENEPTESFIRDIICLLPKICSKLDNIVSKLREDNNHNFREGARLLLCLFTRIFSWKGFLSVTYNTLLREGLRILARQVNEENAQLRSCKELVAESYKYFESLSDIATEISLATALVNVCESLMKHSETYTQQYKDKHAKLAYGFLCLEWPEDIHAGPRYTLSIVQLLNNWIDNEQMPLNTVTSILKWLPDEVSNLENMQSSLTRMPSVNKNIFHLLYKKLFDGLIKGIDRSLLAANSDPERIKFWREIASNVQKFVQICKTLKKKANIQLFLRYMPLLIKQFLNTGMPILEHNLKYQADDVTSIIKMMQGGTRYLHAICCDCTEKKDVVLTKHIPAAKSILEKLVYSVKGMLVLNDSATAFWMGNLVNKNLDGHEILSQTSSEETTLPDINAISAELTNISSEILRSDSDEDQSEDDELHSDI